MNWRFGVCYGGRKVNFSIQNRRRAMMMMKEDEIKEHLMSSDPEFRRLVEEHKQYE